MIKKILLSSILSSATLFAGVYLVPQEYDNMVNSTRSESFGVISQSTANMSGNSYVLGGTAVNFRCLRVSKINCTAATPQINANISETSLKRPSTEELLLTFQTDLRIEEDTATNEWLLCGGAYGGQVWDDSSLSSTDDGSGNIELTYSYTPNSKSEEYWYFTNVANASNQSYLSVTYNQVCQ